MLAARPTSTFQTSPFQSKVSTSKNAGIFSQSSTLNYFNSPVNRHLASIILPNFVSRSSRARKVRNGGIKWTSTLFNRFRIEASLTAEDNARIEEAPLPLQPSAPYSIKIPVGDRHIFVETGHIGRQASGAVTVTDGETIIYTTVCMAEDPSDPSDFFPLSVNYQERFSAAGRTSGGFFKREGKTKDHEVLICRLIDRPLRPTMLKGFYHETQILSWVLSYVGLHSPDSLAVTAAGIAVFTLR